MAFTPSLIGTATGVNVTSLAINVTGNVPAGGKIFCAICINKEGFDSFTDTAGNMYDQLSGSQDGVGAFFMGVSNNLALFNNNHITLAYSIPFSASIGAFAVSGLTSGIMDGASAGQGNSTFPDVALNNVPVNDWMIGVVAVNGPSTDGFTQDPSWNNPGNFNNRVTTGFSAYAGYKQAISGGQIIYAPTLGVSRVWAALMVAVKP